MTTLAEYLARRERALDLRAEAHAEGVWSRIVYADGAHDLWLCVCPACCWHWAVDPQVVVDRRRHAPLALPGGAR